MLVGAPVVEVEEVVDDEVLELVLEEDVLDELDVEVEELVLDVEA